MPTVIAYGSPHLWRQRAADIAEALGCPHVVFDWNPNLMLHLGDLHLSEREYKPRSPYVAAEEATGRPVEKIIVLDFDEAMLLTQLDVDTRAAALGSSCGDGDLGLAPFLAVNKLVALCHGASVRSGWWTDLKTGEDLHGKRNVPELLMLIVSEIAEAMEGHRKRLRDDKLPHRSMIEVELIDALIRIFDLLGALRYGEEQAAGAVMLEKMTYNANRADHKPENRRKEGGKQF